MSFDFRWSPVRRMAPSATVAAVVRLTSIVGLACFIGAASPPPPLAKPDRKAKVSKKHTHPAPKPGNINEERAHVRRYDKAIKSLRETTVSQADWTRLRIAIKAIEKRQPEKAQAAAAKLSNRLAQKLVTWLRLYRGYGTAQEYYDFIAANRNWPDQRLLRRRLEAQLLDDNIDSALIAKAVGNGQARTGAGLAALARQALREGRKSDATLLARRAWRDYDFLPRNEKIFLAEFRRMLRPADHRWRIDRLLGKYVRWRVHRRKQTAPVKRMLHLLSKPERKKVRARIAAYHEKRSATRLLRKLPEQKRPDWGLAFNKVQWLRRKGKHSQANRILLKAPRDPKVVPNLDSWWHERMLAAYRALRKNKPKTAYQLIKDVGPIGVNAANARAFFAGWLALRKLGRPRQALQHFKTLKKSADGPLSRSRAEYWLGRTYEVLGDRAAARGHYRAAARYFDTFDSHLARLKLGGDVQTLRISFPNPPTPKDIKSFRARETVRAAVLGAKAGLKPRWVRRFLYDLRRKLRSEAEFAMLAHLAEALGDTQMAVRVAKTGIVRGYNLGVYAYPLHAFPAYSPLRRPPEVALMLGIARQESEFNTLIKSGAGARGLMQVMPITARHVCRAYKIKCSIRRLTKDKTYNATLASAYIGDRMREFSGSYVLTLAGYNAGPGRVRQWVREFGDPRRRGVDPIDWIQRIPFKETRLYVQKVLSNLQVYRARLANGKTKIRILDDLNRARSGGSASSQRRRADALQSE